jgi:hypothetical protein
MSHKYESEDMPDTVSEIEQEVDSIRHKFREDSYHSYLWQRLCILFVRIAIIVTRRYLRETKHTGE